MRELLIVSGGCLAFTLAILAALLWWKSVQCDSRWSDFEHDWGVASGCRVMIDGRMVPDEQVRDVDLPKSR